MKANKLAKPPKVTPRLIKIKILGFPEEIGKKIVKGSFQGAQGTRM